MNKTLKFAKREQIESALDDALSNGLYGTQTFDDVDYDEEAYAKARKSLIDGGTAEADLTIEAIQARMVMDGGRLKLHDPEERKWYNVTLWSWIVALEKYADEKPIDDGHTLKDVLNGDPDARLDFEDYDWLLQVAALGEYVYG